MLIVRKATDGSMAAVAVGRLIKDASFKRLSTGKEITKFTIQYGYESSGGGRRNGLLLNCDAWELMGEFAAALEKGDTVLTAGKFERDEYWSNKNGNDSYKLTCEIILPQPSLSADAAEDGDEAPPELPSDWTPDF